MRLLLAEDDATLADALVTNLQHVGFEVEHAANGAVAEYLLLRNNFGLGIIDLGLPMIDGLTVLKRVRSAKPAQPLLVLTALDDLEDRVAGLNAGADDYLTKPFDFSELEARIRALIRRSTVASSPASNTAPKSNSQALGPLNLDRDARRCVLAGEVVDLSPREWRLLDLLLSQHDHVITKEQIYANWGAESGEALPATNAVEVYIHRLRRKIENGQIAIRTVRGLGYLLELDRAPA